MIYPELKEIIEREGDENSFEYKGYKCHIRRVGMPYRGHLCGYIEIPADHELYEMDYDEIEDKYQGLLPAHGGLTFSDFIDNNYWIGFDCAHYGDLDPVYIKGFENFRDKQVVYRDMDYVAKNIKQTVDFIEVEILETKSLPIGTRKEENNE